MIYAKSTPVGVDIPITHLQQFIYPELKQMWGIANDTDYDCHGRAYRNQVEDGYIPEVFTGTGNVEGQQEYQELYFDDTKKATSFFFLGEKTRYDRGNATAPVSLVFAVNVPDLKPGITWRGDEEIRNDVERLLEVDRFQFNLVEIILGIDEVFKEFSGWRKKEGLKFRDMHPSHCFRLNFQVLYDINDHIKLFKYFK